MNDLKRYFEELLNVKSNTSQTTQTIPPAEKDLPINTGPISIDEVQQAIKQLKNGKSPGLDHIITPEILKYGGDWIVHKLCNICNEIFENQTTPTSSFLYPKREIKLSCLLQPKHTIEYF